VKLFVSYSHEDQEAVNRLITPLRRNGHFLWMDEELHARGGTEWWKEIVKQIMELDAVLLALTDNWVESEVCVAEFEWANQLGRNIVPLKLADLNPSTLPVDLQPLQIVDYTQPPELAVADLLATVSGLGDPPELPHPVPDAPEMPKTEIYKYRKRVESGDYIDQAGQIEILQALERWLTKPKLRGEALELVDEFAARDDITVVNHRRAEELLDKWRPPTGAPGPVPGGAVTPGGEAGGEVPSGVGTPVGAEPVSERLPPPPSGTRWASTLAVAIATPDWHGVASCEAEVRLRPRLPGKQDYADVHVQPAIPGQQPMDFATDFLRLHPLQPSEQAVTGFVPTAGRPQSVERTLVKQKPTVQLRLLQRMWAAGAQRVAVTATESLRPIVDGMEIALSRPASDPAALDTANCFSPSIAFADVTGLTVAERLTLVRQDTGERITVDHEELEEGADADSWYDAKVGAFMAQLAASDPRVVSKDSGKLFGQLPSTVVTVRSRQTLPGGGLRYVLTKMGFACAGSDTYQLTISLGEEQQGRFSGLVRHARLMA